MESLILQDSFHVGFDMARSSFRLWIGSYRQFGSSRLGNTIKMTYQRALVGEQEYLNHLQHPTEVHDVDPALSPYRTRALNIFNANPQRYNQSRCDFTRNKQPAVPFESLFESPSPSKGCQASYTWNHFGRLSAYHANPFEIEADILMIPTTPNCLPQQGIGLELLERGGKPLINAIMEKVEELLFRPSGTSSSFSRGNSDRKVPHKFLVDKGVKGSSSNVSDSQQAIEPKTQRLKQQSQLLPGDVLLIPSYGAAKSPEILLVVLPFFFESTPVGAAQLFRRATRQAFNAAVNASSKIQKEASRRSTTSDNRITLAVPMLGHDIQGFKPLHIARTLLQEGVETLLQLDKICPEYRLKEIRFVASTSNLTQQLTSALHATATRWLPDRQVKTSSEYVKTQKQRLLILSPREFRSIYTREKLLFPRGRVLRRKHKRRGTSRPAQASPYFWRRAIAPPPPTWVYASTGEVARYGIRERVVHLVSDNEQNLSVDPPSGFKKLRVVHQRLRGDPQSVQPFRRGRVD